MNWRKQLDILQIPDEDLSEAIGKCEGLKAALWQRLQSPATQPAPKPSEYLTAKEAAALCKCSVQFVYDHAAQLGGGQVGNGQKRPWRFRERDVIAFVEREGL